jgi:hypothetical protein
LSDITDLAHGAINAADELSVQLIQPADHPSFVRIVWPAKPSIIPPSRFNAVAADIMRVFAAAVTKHNRIKVHGQ